jgi:hypothetical protein
VFDLIARHFLASVSEDASQIQGTISFDIDGEIFTLTGHEYEKKGFLEVFSCFKAVESPLPDIKNLKGASIKVTFHEGTTSPPSLFTESDLISEMDWNLIGTDATIHEHIKTVVQRGYVKKIGDKFYPSSIGIILVEVFDHIGLPLFKPNFRAQMEKDIQSIIEGTKTKEDVLDHWISTMKDIYTEIVTKLPEIKELVRDKSALHKTSPLKHLPECILLQVGLNEKESILQNLKNRTPKKGGKRYKDMDIIMEEVAELEVTECPKCKIGTLKVKYNCKTKCYYCAWSHYPSWNITVSLCRGIDEIKMLEEDWYSCDLQGRKTKRFWIKFDQKYKQHEKIGRYILDEQKWAGIFCIYYSWDETFQGIKDVIKEIDGDNGDQKSKFNFYCKKGYQKKTKKFFKFKPLSDKKPGNKKFN